MPSCYFSVLFSLSLLKSPDQLGKGKSRQTLSLLSQITGLVLPMFENPCSELYLGQMCYNFKNTSLGAGSDVVFSNYSISTLIQQ